MSTESEEIAEWEGRLLKAEAACAEKHAALMAWDSYFAGPLNPQRFSSCMAVHKHALSTDCGSALLEENKGLKRDVEIRDQQYKEAYVSWREQGSALIAKVAAMEKALRYCKTNNHADTDRNKHHCLGHECRVCDAIDNALSSTAENAIVKELEELREQRAILKGYLSGNKSDSRAVWDGYEKWQSLRTCEQRLREWCDRESASPPEQRTMDHVSVRKFLDEK